MFRESLYTTEISPYRIECAKKMTGKVLDVGGGLGVYLPYFSGETTILDVSEEALAKVVCANKVVADAAQPPFEDNTFDSIFMCGVAQYFENFDCVIKEMKRILKPEGIILLIVGNSASPWDKIKSIFGMRTWNQLEGAKSFFTPKRLKAYGRLEGEIRFLPFEKIFRHIPCVSHTITCIMGKG